MSLQSGINQISGQRGNAYDAGLYATQGITAVLMMDNLASLRRWVV
ncbi:hypothetical protein MGH68_13790 [Erysipelothrix sp. D19-032]